MTAKACSGEGFDAWPLAQSPQPQPSSLQLLRNPAASPPICLARAPAEDVAAYDPAVLAKAGALAEKAVLSHRKGESVIAVDTDPATRPQRPPAHHRHRRQRQHAVPVRFGARRDHRHGRRAELRHPSGDRRQARQEGRQRDRCRRRQGRGCRSPFGHPYPYQCAFGRRGARPEGAARQGADAGARRRRRLEADARPARPRDLGVPLPADPARQGRRRRGDRLPRMAARRQFHLPRHARVPLFRRREDRHADPRREPGPRHPRRSRRPRAAPRRGRGHHARDPRLPATARIR